MFAVAEWHIVIGGFCQHEGDPAGPCRLWLELVEKLASSAQQVLFREWNADWSGLAEFISRTSINSGGPRVCVYAYSWGAGYGATKLAKELRKRGIRIETMVLCDPVYHSRLFIMRWLAFVPWCRISVPDNVKEVLGVQQRQSWLHGHKVVAENKSRTKIKPFVVRNRNHCWMDDDPFFHKMCLEAAGVTPCVD